MPIRHRMKLTPENFDRVKSGDKKFEFRLNDEKRKALKVGERVEFAKLPELEKNLIVEIVSLDVFPSFADLYRSLPQAIGGYTESEFIDRMRNYYSAEEEEKYGVVAIGLKLIQFGE